MMKFECPYLSPEGENGLYPCGATPVTLTVDGKQLTHPITGIHLQGGVIERICPIATNPEEQKRCHDRLIDLGNISTRQS